MPSMTVFLWVKVTLLGSCLYTGPGVTDCITGDNDMSGHQKQSKHMSNESSDTSLSCNLPHKSLYHPWCNEETMQPREGCTNQVKKGGMYQGGACLQTLLERWYQYSNNSPTLQPNIDIHSGNIVGNIEVARY
jgi:hypothetical protein